jgi:hypothetical protein
MSGKIATIPKTLSAKDSYIEYSKKLLNENSTLTAKRAFGLVYGKVFNEDGSIYIDYNLYKKILSLIYIKAGVKLIQGRNFNLGSALGYIFIMRQGRNPTSKPRLNKGESFKYKKELEASGKEITKDNWKIYYTDEEFTRTNWSKVSYTRNILFYKFSPANGQPGKGFKQTMSRAISSNSNLLINYPYIPYKAKIINVSI